jgi:hypothetical protein
VEIKTLAELQQPDEASLMFGPWGLGRMTAEDAAKFQQGYVAAYELTVQVPDSTRQSLQLRSGRAPMRFDGMLDSLLRWARAEGLLGGQRDRVRDRPRLNLRNLAAHPSYHLGMPPDAAAEIADLAAIINRLWSAPRGLPHSREVVIIAWDDRTVIWGAAHRFETGGYLTGEESCVVIRAGPHDDLGAYDSLYEAVTTPCEYL